ncbi:MAG: DUF5710 domain-containing protein, partial [Deltaproteobacteria bacterium]|nr:DUF5710 domain-containing protein [Deltaproteobacteria bacterium]
MADTDYTKDKRDDIAERITRMIEESTAPWMKPWKPYEAFMNRPRNPVTGTFYGGVNMVTLQGDGHADPRWFTFRNAKEMGYMVRKGARGVPVEYWKFSRTVNVVDELGRPVIGPDGKKETRKVELSRPMVKFSHVFNAAQLTLGNGEPLPPFEFPRRPENDFALIGRGESLVNGSGARIMFDQGNRNFYRPGTDTIHMTPKEAFDDPPSFYSTALHEIGHWTGHGSRLGRAVDGGRGSKEYAREELRVEIASWLIALETGLPHDPTHTAAYLKSWAAAVKTNPGEIARAVADAQKIKDYILGLEREYLRGRGQEAPAAGPGPYPGGQGHGQAGQASARGEETPGRANVHASLDSLVDAESAGPGYSSVLRDDPANFPEIGGEARDFVLSLLPHAHAMPINGYFIDHNADYRLNVSCLDIPEHPGGKLIFLNEIDNGIVFNPENSHDVLTKSMIMHLDKDDRLSCLGLDGHARPYGNESPRLPVDVGEMKDGREHVEVATRWIKEFKDMDLLTDPIDYSILNNNDGIKIITNTKQEQYDNLPEITGENKDYLLGLMANARKGARYFDKDGNERLAVSDMALQGNLHVSERKKDDDIADMKEISFDVDDDGNVRIVKATDGMDTDIDFTHRRIIDLADDKDLDATRTVNGWIREFRELDLEARHGTETGRGGEPGTEGDASPARTLLKVDYAERGQAKGLGAKWDVDRKSWFVPAGTDLAPFSRWLPKEDSLTGDQGREATPKGPPAREDRDYLLVPFSENGQAKSLGARWDREAKLWYAPDGADPSAFARWTPRSRPIPEDRPGPAQDLREAMGSCGLEAGEPRMDGQTHRVPLKGEAPGGNGGAYRASLGENPSGSFQNVKTGERHEWNHTAQGLGPGEAEALGTEAELRVEAMAEDRRAREALALRRAERRIRDNSGNLAAALESFPFLDRNGIKAPEGVLFERKGGRVTLLVPASVPGPPPPGQAPRIQTYLAIGPDGQGGLAKGCPRNGAVFMVEDGAGEKMEKAYPAWASGGKDPSSRPQILIAADLAAAKRLHDATGRPVACSLGQSNLKAAAENLARAYPEAAFVVCADRDPDARGNDGLGRAKAAAAAIGAPVFTRPPQEGELPAVGDLTGPTGLAPSRIADDGTLGAHLDRVFADVNREKGTREADVPKPRPSPAQ